LVSVPRSAAVSDCVGKVTGCSCNGCMSGMYGVCLADLGSKERQDLLPGSDEPVVVDCPIGHRREVVTYYPSTTIARFARSSNSTTIGGELMKMRDPVAGTLFYVVCTLYPARTATSTSLEQFGGKQVRIFAFPPSNIPIYKNQFSQKFSGGLQQAYLMSQKLDLPKTFMILENCGVVVFAKSMAFREWSHVFQENDIKGLVQLLGQLPLSVTCIPGGVNNYCVRLLVKVCPFVQIRDQVVEFVGT